MGAQGKVDSWHCESPEPPPEEVMPVPPTEAPPGKHRPSGGGVVHRPASSQMMAAESPGPGFDVTELEAMVERLLVKRTTQLESQVQESTAKQQALQLQNQAAQQAAQQALASALQSSMAKVSSAGEAVVKAKDLENLVQKQELKKLVQKQELSELVQTQVEKALLARNEQTRRPSSTVTRDEQAVLNLVQKEVAVQVQRALLTRDEEGPPHVSSSPRGGGSHMPAPLQSPTSAQGKAAWASGTFTAVAMTPAAPEVHALSHDGLEEALMERVAASQPDHQALGFSQVVVRDMVNSVVREIVGVFEALLDRLLIEKKTDTIRQMVAELLTEDIAATIATGREQLKKQELGHIIQELEKLRVEVRDGSTVWEERFRVTHELKDSQEDLWTTLDERYRNIEARLASVETDFVSRSEMNDRMKVVVVEFEDCRRVAVDAQKHDDETRGLVASLEASCKEIYAAKGDLSEASASFAAEVAGAKEEALHGLKELRDYAAAEARVAEMQASVDESLRTLHKGLFEAKQESSSCNTQLAKMQRMCDATFATKFEAQQDKEELQPRLAKMESSLREDLERLQATAATKEALQEEKAAAHARIDDIQQMAATSSSALRETSANLKGLVERCNSSFATREYAQDVARTMLLQVAKERDGQEEIAGLRREFEEERERLRQNVRQQQKTSKELLEFMEDIASVSAKCDELNRQCGKASDRVRSVDEREAEHWEQFQGISAKLNQSHGDLDVFYKALRDEFDAHAAQQRTESEQLRLHSTQRYLEQMDKALNLRSSLEKMEVGHRELNEKVSGIKLPKM